MSLQIVFPEDVVVGDVIHANAAGGGFEILELLPSTRSDYKGLWKVRTPNGRETTVAWNDSTRVVKEVR